MEERLFQRHAAPTPVRAATHPAVHQEPRRRRSPRPRPRPSVTHRPTGPPRHRRRTAARGLDVDSQRVKFYRGWPTTKRIMASNASRRRVPFKVWAQAERRAARRGGMKKYLHCTSQGSSSTRLRVVGLDKAAERKHNSNAIKTQRPCSRSRRKQNTRRSMTTRVAGSTEGLGTSGEGLLCWLFKRCLRLVVRTLSRYQGLWPCP